MAIPAIDRIAYVHGTHITLRTWVMRTFINAFLFCENEKEERERESYLIQVGDKSERERERDLSILCDRYERACDPNRPPTCDHQGQRFVRPQWQRVRLLFCFFFCDSVFCTEYSFVFQVLSRIWCLLGFLRCTTTTLCRYYVDQSEHYFLLSQRVHCSVAFLVCCSSEKMKSLR